MYKRILVPLDGSSLSERSLPHAMAIARGCENPEVIFLRILEPLSATDMANLAQAGGDFIIQVENVKKAEATDYLKRTTDRYANEKFTVRGELVEGKPREGILDFASKNQIDLIIMTTHGRSGLSRWTMGSVAESVSRHSEVPVLLVTPSNSNK